MLVRRQHRISNTERLSDWSRSRRVSHHLSTTRIGKWRFSNTNKKKRAFGKHDDNIIAQAIIENDHAHHDATTKRDISAEVVQCVQVYVQNVRESKSSRHDVKWWRVEEIKFVFIRRLLLFVPMIFFFYFIFGLVL